MKIYLIKAFYPLGEHYAIMAFKTKENAEKKAKELEKDDDTGDLYYVSELGYRDE